MNTRDIIFENSDILIISLNLSMESETIISFGHLNTKVDGLKFWGDDFFEKTGRNAIGIVPKWNHWYAPDLMAEPLDVVRENVSKFEFRTTYGISMGGYGALRHSKTLGADKVICVSPQYSINPKDVLNYDNRFCDYYISQKHENMALKAGQYAENSLLIYDPFDKVDKIHAENINMQKTMQELKVPFSGHQSIVVLIETGAGKCLLGREPVTTSWRIARQQIRSSKFKSVKYLRTAATALKRRGNKEGALKLLRSALAVSPASIDLNAYTAYLLAELGRGQEALELMNSLNAELKVEFEFLQNLAVLYRKMDRWDDAIEVANKALETEPDNAQLFLLISQCHIGAGRITEALDPLKSTDEHAPKNGNFQFQLAKLFRATKQPEPMFKAISSAYDLNPANDLYKKTWIYFVCKHGHTRHYLNCVNTLQSRNSLFENDIQQLLDAAENKRNVDAAKFLRDTMAVAR